MQSQSKMSTFTSKCPDQTEKWSQFEAEQMKFQMQRVFLLWKSRNKESRECVWLLMTVRTRRSSRQEGSRSQVLINGWCTCWVGEVADGHRGGRRTAKDTKLEEQKTEKQRRRSERREGSWTRTVSRRKCEENKVTMTESTVYYRKSTHTRVKYWVQCYDVCTLTPPERRMDKQQSVKVEGMKSRWWRAAEDLC